MPTPMASRSSAKPIFRADFMREAINNDVLLVGSIAGKPGVAGGWRRNRIFQWSRRCVRSAVGVLKGGGPIGDQQFPATLQYRLEFTRANQVAEPLHGFLRSHQIASFLALP